MFFVALLVVWFTLFACVCVCVYVWAREKEHADTCTFWRWNSSVAHRRLYACVCVLCLVFCLHCGLSEDSGATNDNKTIHGTYRRYACALLFNFACVLVDVFRARSLALIRLELVVCSFFRSSWICYRARGSFSQHITMECGKRSRSAILFCYGCCCCLIYSKACFSCCRKTHTHTHF